MVLAAEGLGLVGPAECPSIHASTLPGHFSISPDYADGDYEVETVEVGYVVNAFGYSDDIDIVPFAAPEFATVSDSRGLQRELQVGTTHIMVTQHMDLTQVSLPDLPTQFLTLDDPAVRVLNTTLSIAVRSSYLWLCFDVCLILFFTYPPLCAGALWPMPAWVWRDLRSVLFINIKFRDSACGHRGRPQRVVAGNRQC